MQILLRRLILFLSVTATIAIFPRKAFATHLAGSDISYTYLGGNSYRIDLTFYRDCRSPNGHPLGVGIEFRSASCNQYFTDTLLLVSGTGNEITYPCPGLTTACDDPNSPNPGIQEWKYSGIVNFPIQCFDWVISWTYCCRNCDITTMVVPQPCVPGTNPPMYVSTTLDNLNHSGNSAPHFTNNPIVFVCVGQNFTYNHGAVDPDGDSLVYSLVNPLINSTDSIPFIGGYSATNPITSSPALTIDPVTGDIVMTPTQTEVGVLSVQVDEYRNGVLIGHVIRDMEIYVRPCSNNLPTATGINGTAVHDTTVCPGTQICFDVFSNDSDANQIVTMTWNSGIDNATFTVSGFPYPTGHFCWTPTVADISSVPHVFTVQVVDNNCPNSGYQIYSFTINVNSPLVNINVTDISCHGLTDGAITVVPVNPPGNFSYVWSTSDTTAGISNLTAGPYSVTVLDSATGCSATFSDTITDPAVLTDTAYVSNQSCPSSNSGVAVAVASGGTAPYTYTWNTVPPQVNDTATALGPGSYDVIITDAHGCTASNSVTVGTSSAALVINVDSVSSLLCFGDNYGIASISVSGGTPGYTYIWNTVPPQDSSTATGLSAGTYTVIVTDTVGCSQSQNATVTSPPQIIITGFSVPASCGASDGSAYVEVTGGTPGYTYVWSGFPNTTDSLGGVPVGIYTVTVSDSNGCSIPFDVLVQSAVISSTANAVSSLTCHDDSNATAVATASGGTAPYIFTWNTIPPQVNDTATGLSAGTYVVTISDSANCTTVDTVIIPNPPLLNISVATSASSCSGDSTGVATATVLSGIGPYTYSWSPYGGTDSVATGLIPGVFIVTVTDATGCSNTSSVTINQTTPIVITVDTVIDPLCNGINSGAINVTVSGGAIPYTYAWTPGGAPTEDIANISAGIYVLVVTDQNNCTNSQQVNVNQPSPVTVDAGSDTAICSGGSIQLNATLASGTTGVWSSSTVTFVDPTDPHTIANVPQAGFNTATWTATDGNGCSSTDNITIFNFQNLSIDAGLDISLCGSLVAQLNADTLTGFTGTWTGSTNVNFNDPTLNTTGVSLTDFGVDTLTWTISGNACITSDYLVFAAYELPSAEAGDSQTVCENKAKLFAISGSAGSGIWSVRLPSTASIVDPLNPETEVRNLVVGNTVFVWTVNNGTCSASDTVLVVYDEACDLDLPSGFSPNGDNFNDGYIIHGIEGYPNNVFRVFNRWGNEVFTRTNYTNDPPGWIGQNKDGDVLPEATYYVILEILDKGIKKNTFVDLRLFKDLK